MRSIEITGKSYDEALEDALKQLNVTKDKVEVEVKEEGSKGLFNLFGAKPTKLKVTVKLDYKDKAKDFLLSVLKSMKIDAQVEITEKEEYILFNVIGNEMGTVIGYRGETLDSLQYLLSLVVNKEHDKPYKKIVLDTENYRKKREETLRGVAEKTANRVLKNKRAFKLEPMNPYERRIIHSALQGKSDIYTYSEGQEPYRRIVVDIKRDF